LDSAVLLGKTADRQSSAPLDIVLSPHDVVEPDLFYISHGRAADVMTPQHVRGAPELVIEIASTSTRKRDETIKRRLYERHGVSEYWVVDPELDAIRVYRREGDRFGRAVEFTSERGDVLTTPLIPGLEIALARIFAEPAGGSGR
jgi:Uma2 family endonuclease